MIAAAAVLIAGLTSCSTGGTGEVGSTDPTLKLGSIIDVASFDPAQSDVGHLMQYLQPAYDTLIRIDENGELQPMLATAWEYTDSKNLNLKLELRDDVKFSDGTAMTPQAVVASLERFAAGNGPRASALASVTAYDAAEANTVVLTLASPDPALTHNLGLVAGMITNPEVSDSDLANIPAGTGPYVLDVENTSRGDVYQFTRNAEYYDTESFPFAGLEIRLLTDPTARLNAIKTGQIDAVFGTPSQSAEAVASGLSVVSTPGDWQGLFLIDRDGKTNPAMGDVRVRQAINYAIDGDAILATVAFGEGTSTTQIFYPGSPAYDESLNAAYPFDPAKAEALLAEAGYGEGLTLAMPSSDTFLADIYPIVQQQLADVGITVEYVPETPTSGLAPYLSGDLPAYAFSWGSSQNWLDATLLLAANGGWNPLKVDDPKISELMNSIALASGDEQDALYKQLSEYVVEQAWFNPFYVVNNLYFVGPNVSVTAQAQQVVPSIYNFSPAS